ncbi:hypothetical protein [Glycomyces dulcitolivorans]|uniref:hypothetical protein n=1 Tax=Glycomyces dulcitolivorans TaxID=2200759 RepID=UPI000DD3E1F2|nr:hypothetical protein [Glycomyces dulcitolivorans]
MDAADTRTHPLDALALAEDAFQQARARLKEAETDRYASIWAALTTAEDLTELRAMLPPTVTAQSLRAAVRRHATGDTGYIQPELFDGDGQTITKPE